jgi:hypothetical protein
MSRKIWFLALTVLLVSSRLPAAEKKKQDPAEVRFYFGLGTLQYLSQDISNASYSKSTFGLLGVSYLKTQGKSRVKLGMNMTYQHIGIDGGYAYSQSQNHLSFFPELQVTYFQQEKAAVYADFCYGIDANIHSTNVVNQFPSKGEILFSDLYQVSPLCFLFSGKTPMFLELGYGCKGVVNVGFQIKIYGRKERKL